MKEIAGDLADRRQRRHVRHDLVQPRLRARRARPARRSGTIKHKLGPITTYCCGPNNRGVAVYGDKVYLATLDCQARRARRQDRQAGMGDRHRRPRTRLQRNDGADRGQGQSPDRHQRRRIRHPRLRQGVRRQDRQAACGPSTRSRRIQSGRVGDERRHRPRHASRHRRPKRPAYAKNGDPVQDARRRRVAEPVRRPRRPTASSSSSAIPRPISTARIRPGDNLYTDSLVSLDLDTGKYVCHFQYIAHDVWDLDAVSPAVLVDVKDKDGKVDPGRAARRQDRPYLCARPQGLQPDPLLRGDGAAGEHVDAADQGGRAHAARRQRRRRMVADRDQPARSASPTRSTCTSR